jgi:hypothetical protein
MWWGWFRRPHLTCITSPLTPVASDSNPHQDIEEGLVKRDLKRQKLQESRDAPAMVARMNELHDTALARRGKMMLPAPQVGGAVWILLRTVAAA